MCSSDLCLEAMALARPTIGTDNSGMAEMIEHGVSGVITPAGDVDALAMQREMIRRTIKEHLDKEKRLRPLGIKVLSLFFIDAVEKYRRYDTNGNAVKGDYARIFEEEYRRAAKLPAYQSLFAEIDLESAAEAVKEHRKCDDPRVAVGAGGFVGVRARARV